MTADLFSTGADKQCSEKAFGDKDGNYPCNSKTDEHIFPDRVPLHNIGLADIMPSLSTGNKR